MASAQVVIAEDESDFRAILIDYLSAHNVTALGAGNGVEALNLLKENPGIHLLLSDIRMPGHEWV